ncbi:heavy-metal-associated domain-containing protein [Castellaniella sp. S9]|uniref:heavy-metal-associated domain-containing protein n=1 Tax=Castellaniella sp. S9 TaxID=2993652 RepID=UPI0022B40ADB|nr:heavy-metal-associated domain-containing protein [Castellaniella sp. S9]
MTTQMSMRKAVFTMEPFTCPSCVKKIENTVSKIDGVQEVKVMFNSGRVRVEFDEDRTTADTVQETIVKLGYPVLSKKVA